VFGVWRMYLILLAFGVLLIAAGIALGAPGVSISDRAFDIAIVAPGAIAMTGGLILIGLGFALRVLQRIEAALAARPMPRITRPGEPVAETPSEAARLPASPKPEPVLQTLPADTAAHAEAAEARAPQLARLQFPNLTRVESAAVLEESEVSLAPGASLRVDQAVGEINSGRIARQSGGSGRITPRFDLSTRPSRLPERPKGPTFDALWPKGRRPIRTEPPASAADVAPSVPPPTAAPEQSSEPALELPAAPAPEETPEPVSVLKSGVVDGMAYTLYSDGSIEAELPQGAVRFGSITELRNHIEQGPPDAASS